MAFGSRDSWSADYLKWIGAYALIAIVGGAAINLVTGLGSDDTAENSMAAREALARETYQECIEAQADAMMAIEDRRDMILAIDAIHDDGCEWHILPFSGPDYETDTR